jgi:eukaryotic-like serine/threonine-protein kinase
MTVVSAGTRLGPYEVVSRVGAGGMGEVWKARDTRLDRSVAIKILPIEFAKDAALKLRFEREAKTISQLTHPHICTLYDIGDGYLVMELLDGDTLADRIERGPMPLADVFRYGAQIGEALDRAHRGGVVHRDLKPGNVMITKAGAKLLDFGLAKASELDVFEGATVQKPLTQEGTILGTFQYMAPEQLEASQVDARTDIFALGAVLYEMATGQRAFQAKSKASLIAAIVKEQPPPMSALVSLTPPAFEHVVAKCLAKDPEDRWQSARDVSQVLRWIGEGGSQIGVPAPVAATRRKNSRLAWTVTLIASLLAVAAGFVAWRTKQRIEPPQVMRFSAPDTIAVRPVETYGTVAISPDGRVIVYSSTTGSSRILFRRPIDQFEPAAIAGSEGGIQPFFSPDGKWVGFFARQKLWKVPLSGGSPTELARAPRSRGAEWLDDDTIIFCPYYYGGIERVSSSGGAVSIISKVDSAAGERSHRWPRALPGGKVILYSVGMGGSWDKARIMAHDLESGKRTIVINGGTDARYVPTGHLVYVRGTSLYAVPFDVDALEVRGQPVEVTSGVANHSAGGAEFSFSRNGTLVYFSPGVGGDEGGRLAMMNRRGDRLPALLPDGPFGHPQFSPSGNAIASERDFSIWTIDLQRGTSTRLATGARMGWPIWSADGARILYASERSGPWQIWSRAADGSDEERRVSNPSDYSVTPSAISPDGAEVLVQADHRESATDVEALDRTGAMRAIVRTDADDNPGVFSPDGRYIAYFSDESGRDEVYVRPRNGAGRWQISNQGGTEPRWVLDNEIAYLSGTKIMTVAVKTTPTFTVGTPELLFEAKASNFDLARDGRVLIVEPPDASNSGRLNVVVNWFEEIRK